MKYAIVADLHSVSPEPVLGEGDRVIALGDYDNPKILEDLLRIPDAVICIGNHDHRLVVEYQFPNIHKEWLGSYFLPAPKTKEYFRLMKRWNNNETARRYVEAEASERNGLVGLKEIELSGKKVACIHSSLIRGESLDRAPCSLWTKMSNDWVYGENFRQMRAREYWLLLRGHSHCSSAVSVPDNADLSRESFSMNRCKMEFDNKFTLDGNRMYLLSLGIFRWGEYAVYDSETGEFEFRRRG